MFYHNFKYTFKTLLKNKMLLFWTFAFAIILGTFFNMAFSNIESSEKLEIIDIAIVDSVTFKKNPIFSETFKVLSDKNSKDQLFNTKYVTLDEAEILLNSDQITGYLVLEDVPEIIVKENGINETIFKNMTEEIYQTAQIMNNVITHDVENGLNNEKFVKIAEQVYQTLQEKANIQDISNNNLSYMVIEFYTLIAMVCLYSGVLSMVSVNQSLANMSHRGKRIAVSPTSKKTLIFSGVLASYIVQLMGVVIIFLYTTLILNVDYGNNLSLIILLAIVGSLAGLSFGVAVAILFKTNDDIKIGIITSVTMLWCFLSGMMGVTMKYIIDKNIPIINQLNPANMITDGFYALYYYDTLNRFYFNIISLLIFALLMIIISIFSLRRQKYDSI